MKETIMLFHIEDSRRLSAIRRALLPLKLRVKVISPEEYCQPVGYLAGAPDIAPVQSTGDTGEFSGEMMVMAWLSAGGSGAGRSEEGRSWPDQLQGGDYS